MKKKMLLFVSVFFLSLALTNVNVMAFDGFIRGGITGIIVGKFYDFIFGEKKSYDSDNVKKDHVEKNNEKSSSEEKKDIDGGSRNK